MDATTTVPIVWLVAAVSSAIGVAGTLAVGLLRARRAEQATERHERLLHALELRTQATELGQRDSAQRLAELRAELREMRAEILERLDERLGIAR